MPSPATSALSDTSSSGSDQDFEDRDSSPAPTFSFPLIDAHIRRVIAEYGPVFPKLNFTAPQDAVWALSEAGALKCTSPADVYIALKCSDIVNHDLDPRS